MSAQKPIKAFKHKHATRAAIPSHEEAGAEAASPKVAQGSTVASYLKNPIVHRGQDPELFSVGTVVIDASEFAPRGANSPDRADRHAAATAPACAQGAGKRRPP